MTVTSADHGRALGGPGRALNAETPTPHYADGPPEEVISAVIGDGLKPFTIR
jgi:hypothetical protein